MNLVPKEFKISRIENTDNTQVFSRNQVISVTLARNLSSGFSTMSATNPAVQPQKNGQRHEI